MARTTNRLKAVSVASRKRPGYYADGGNLYLRVAPGGSKGWVFRFRHNGRTRDAGLGTYPAISLEKAREQAQRWRRLVAAGVDPIEQRNSEREAARVAAAKAITFEQCAKAFIASHEPAWKNEKHRQQWRNTLATYVYPVIGALPVHAVDTGLVMKVLEPIWGSKPETGSRVRGRIEAILSWAKVCGYRNGENPAQWRGHLDQTFPAKAKVRGVKHHAALPYREIGALVAQLGEESSITARALEFLILTAARTSEALGAEWDELDLQQRIWMVPAVRMKAGREHRVPLSTRATAIIKEMADIRQSEFLFPGGKRGRALSQMALAMLLRRKGYGHATVHGFRSAFRDWAAEGTSFPHEVAEMALAHTVGNKVEAAYRRGDLLEKRRRLMDAWANFCAHNPERGAVVPLVRRKV